jgi:outer membrane protein OmpA-like peptidoglycan-associated protein
VRDDFGYWTDVDILPWQLTIPHEDVVFATNQSEIPPDEAPKLEAAWGEIESAVRKYGELVTVTLWVGGYTDTVGDASDNQALSERRAMSLARWFKTRGYKAVVWYQGFGESVLAVQTADAVDEQRNRRALYVLTAGSPPSGADTPRSAWKKLP